MALARRSIAVAVLLTAALAAPADAGTYSVYSCNLPDGTRAPIDGWRAEGLRDAAAQTSNTCALPASGAFAGSLNGGLPGTTEAGRAVAWVFTAPRDTVITDFTLFRTAHLVSGPYWSHYFTLSYSRRGDISPGTYADFCSPHGNSCWGRGVGAEHPFDPGNRLAVSGIQVQQLVAQIACYFDGAGRCEPTSDHGWFRLYSSRVGLDDLHPPALGRPSGSLLATDAPLEGEESISFSATDRGGGIEKVGVAVDGALVVQRAAIDPVASRCRRPFVAVVPCPLARSTTLAFDTAQLSNGRHTVQASVTDAAGNETRSDPVSVTTLNGSQPNGRGASRFVKLNAWLRSKRDKPRRAAVVPYGASRFAEGRLTDAGGHPISGAVLQASSRVRRPGAKFVKTGTVTTSEDGRFAYRIAKGPSRTIRFAYKAYTLDPAPVQTATLSLQVKAGIRLKLTPHRVTNGQKVRFKGTLKGGPARKGTRVTIDVLVPDARRRVPIGNVKADAKGRFKFAYRFRRTLVKARYRFQARLTPQPGYPYRGATSRRVSVVVSP
jgi:hypothetical protein